VFPKYAGLGGGNKSIELTMKCYFITMHYEMHAQAAFKAIMKPTNWLVLLLGLSLGAIVKADAAEPKVVASIYPLHSLTAGVMAGVGTPILLLESGLSPHDFALKPSQARLLQAADLVVWIGVGLEYPLVRFVENLSPERSLALTDQSSTGEPNLHLWLDPVHAQLIVTALVDRLSALDPQHAARYSANGNALYQRLDELTGELEMLLGPVRAVPYIVFHDAYGRFERRFGLAHRGAVTPDPERRPGARQVRRIRAAIVDIGAVCIFREPQFNRRILSAIVEDRDIQVGELDPLGAGLEPGVNGYFQLMRNLASEFVRCLSRQ
jgi:zinc transport system substrate-binding protein